MTDLAEKETSDREKASMRTKMGGLYVKLALIGRYEDSSVPRRDSGEN